MGGEKSGAQITFNVVIKTSKSIPKQTEIAIIYYSLFTIFGDLKNNFLFNIGKNIHNKILSNCVYKYNFSGY